MEKITAESITAQKEELDKLRANADHIDTSKEQRVNINAEANDLTQSIKYNQAILDQGNKTGKNGQPLLGKGANFEITLNTGDQA